MTEYSVYCKSASYRETFYSLSAAKKAMRELIKKGYDDVSGSKTRIWANGEWEPLGPITLTGNNKTFIANAGMRKANY